MVMTSAGRPNARAYVSFPRKYKPLRKLNTSPSGAPQAAVVGIAVSADEAIKLAAEERPDVVLMDIRLAGAEDGITAAREIRSRYGIQSIFVTANTDPSTLTQAKAVGPIGVLEKPLTQERLKAKLALVGGHS